MVSKVISSVTLGVDIDSVESSNKSGLALGTRVVGADGTEFVYVKSATVIAQYDAVGVDEDFAASALTKAMADDGWMIGFAQVAASAAAKYLWVAVRGANIKVKLAASCAADVPLYTTATAGVLDDDSTSQTKIDGVVAVAAVTTAAAGEIIATFPKATTF